MQANGAQSAEAVGSSSPMGASNEQISEVGTSSSHAASNGVPNSRTQTLSPQQQPHHSHPSQQTGLASSTTNLVGQGITQGAHVDSNVQQNLGGYRQQRHSQSNYQNQHYHQQKYNSSKDDSESNVNYVLLITVINPHYPITCELLHQICGTYGKVNRIVIFKKNGVQAMVEFDNVESAKRAKSMLYGCDIYSGCCTLRIEYAKPKKLNVHKNDSESFDYTNPNLGSGGESESGSGDHQNIQASATPHHAGYQHSTGNHHPRSGSSGNRRSGNGNGGGGPHHSHFHQSQQHLQSPHPKQSVPPTSANHQHHHHHHGTTSGYGMSEQPLEQTSTDPADAFQHHHQQQDGGFNVSRSGYVGVDPFLTSHGPPHQIHGSLYSRQDSHHQQHRHSQHHSRGGGPISGSVGSGSGGGGNGPLQNHHNSSFSHANPPNASMVGPHGTVMMVYGLHPERVNCDRLFNLFCLYGNVVRVKFLRTKEGCAMVQMGDMLAVDRCVSSLNKITLFGSELQISFSKQAFLHDVVQPFILPDGSPSFKDFMGNKNNRFKNPEVASKNRILPPSQVLHFFNAPFGITEDELVHLFKQTADHEPVSLKIFTPKAETTKSFSGLVTFRDPAEATEALVLCNHLSMPKAGAPHPHILRLCFSSPPYPRHNAASQIPPASANFAPNSTQTAVN